MYGEVVRAHKKNSLERVIRDLVANKDYDKVKKIIQQLCNDFAYAVHQPHARNGGLIGLAAAAIALGPVCDQSLCCCMYP
jgi:adenine-specific DNA glycosylase